MLMEEQFSLMKLETFTSTSTKILTLIQTKTGEIMRIKKEI